MNKSDQINEISLALSTAQGKMTGAVKDAINPYFKKSYADLGSCWESVRSLLAENNLALIQVTDEARDGVIVETILSHKSGQWISGRLFMAPTKNDPQGIGICISYARRYAMAAMLGIIQIDDDANSVSNIPSENKQSRSECNSYQPVNNQPISKPVEPQTEPAKPQDFWRKTLAITLEKELIPTQYVLDNCKKANWIPAEVMEITQLTEDKAKGLVERIPKIKERFQAEQPKK